MKQRLILHAGYHKTGTTAIQTFATHNREQLRARGIGYPPLKLDSQHDAHNRLAHALAGKGKRGLGQFSKVSDLLASWRESCGTEDLFISGEAFCRQFNLSDKGNWIDKRRKYLQHVSDQLSEFEVSVVIVLRRQDEFAHSAYLENIMKGSSRSRISFKKFRKLLAQQNLRFEENLKAFSESFDQVKVLIYDDLIENRQLCQNFFSSLGIDTKALKEPGRIRRSPDYATARLKRILNPLIHHRKLNEFFNHLIASDTVQTALHHWVPKHQTSFWESETARKAWLKEYENENERIRQKFRPDKKLLFK